MPNQRPWFRIYPPEIGEMQPNFAENVGLQDVPPRDSRPITFFPLFMTMDFLRQIVTETNRYAADYIARKDRIQRFSRLQDWFKVGRPESVFSGYSQYGYHKETGYNPILEYKEARRRKPVRLLSTACRAELNNNGKPKLIEHYNTKMGGVDLADQLVSAYVDDRKTMKVREKVVFNLLQRMVTNAYILYKQNSDAPRLSRLSFLQSIIEDLAPRQQRLPNREPNNARIRLRKIPNGKEKDCSGCSDRNGWDGRKRTRTVCVRCGNGLHKKCKHNHVCVDE
ncbi:Hypothetical predicted protein [Mytilus galloprovincialis]|uniref:PiggyBac transposable element-derived protein domain-containing protein n=1 Tax=Mytilus galloprovincialis TaxID=29158 RepID=A0A8B6EKU8_MYTGA|nr:Hypothetical predicted protein [Mytilus galloprovincialis]